MILEQMFEAKAKEVEIVGCDVGVVTSRRHKDRRSLEQAALLPLSTGRSTAQCRMQMILEQMFEAKAKEVEIVGCDVGVVTSRRHKDRRSLEQAALLPLSTGRSTAQCRMQMILEQMFEAKAKEVEMLDATLGW